MTLRFSKQRLVAALLTGCAFQPALTAHHQSAQAQTSQNVLVIGIDGLRPDSMEAANTPNIDALIANGTYSRNATTSDRTVSGPGWSDILTGSHRNTHEATGNTVLLSGDGVPVFGGGAAQNVPPAQSYPDFLAAANTANPSLQTARFIGNWAPLFQIGTPGGADVSFQGSDANAVSAAVAHYSNNNNSAELGFLYIASPDFAGHAHGFNPTDTNYTNEISNVDAQIGQVISAIQSRANYANEDWVFILTSDHGGDGNRQHSGNDVWQREVPLIVSGDSVRNGSLGYDAKNIDAAATALTHLGVALPSHYVGHAVGLNSVADPRPTLGVGHNLIFNGDAEYDDGFTDHGMDQAITGWNEFRNANFLNETADRNGFQTATILEYGTGGGFPLASDPGPADRGNNFFSAGANSSTSEMHQRIDVSSIADIIDDSGVAFELSAWLGGFAAQNDDADFEARFIAANGTTVLDTVTLNGPNASERGNVTGLYLREDDGDIVSGTRFIEFVLSTTDNDGYADNLGFKIRYHGDLNGDGFVGAQDLDILLANWGRSDITAGSLQDGDANADGVINAEDLQIVRDHWGNGTPAGSNVPEPGTLALIALGGLAITRRRRR